MTAMRKLAPNLTRQRVIVELLTESEVPPPQICAYLLGLVDITQMELLHGPDVHSAHEMGQEGRVHWKTSGTGLYTYPSAANGTPYTLVTVDCYTCKEFNVGAMVDYTRTFFKAVDLEWAEVTR